MEWGIVTAGLSAVAAAASAVAAWRMPQSAARLAHQLTERRAAYDARLAVLQTLMQEREEIWSSEAVRALNAIDIIFADSPLVREAWSELYRTLERKPPADWAIMQEKTRLLIKETALDLGLAGNLRRDDLARVYMPTALREQREFEKLQRAHLTAVYKGQPGQSGQQEIG